MRHACSLAVCLIVAGFLARAQEAGSGISVPATLSGDVLYGNLQNGYAGRSAAAGFRVSLTPSLRFGDHWFAYSALEVRSTSYLGYNSGPDTNQPVRFNLTQAFVGYSRTIGKASILIKAGQLNSAFGSFPPQYDDAKTSFPNPPPGYVMNLPLRPDQLPCGVRDLLYQRPGADIYFHCGGSWTEAYGMVPVTLYGLPGAEVDISFARVDARFQLTNSSPANPQGLTSSSQSAQWTAGGGYTFGSGLHVGLSGFRGLYLDRVVGATNYPADGFGTDLQWARGRWSVNGEWQRFQFNLPRFPISPSEQIAYGELKSILTPRMFVAVRATGLSFAPGQPQQVYEFGFGFRPNNHQLLKLAYERVVNRGNGLELQLVTTVTAFARAFRSSISASP
jgi:hypothetical protein